MLGAVPGLLQECHEAASDDLVEQSAFGTALSVPGALPGERAGGASLVGNQGESGWTMGAKADDGNRPVADGFAICRGISLIHF